MAEYLWPNNIRNLEEQRLIFQIRSEINPIPANLGNPGQCPTNCGELFENHHILVCKNINESPTETYKMLINGNLNEKKKAVTAWMKNMKIFVAGHNGLVGSAILRTLQKKNLLIL